MNRTDETNIRLLNGVAEDCLLRAFGQYDRINERGYVEGIMTAMFIIGGIGDEDFYHLRIRECFRDRVPIAGCALY